MKGSLSFAGFADGRADPTPIPAGFFSELLPVVDDVGELRLTLYAFWALARKPAASRYLRKIDLVGDLLLMEMFGAPHKEADARLTAAPRALSSRAEHCCTFDPRATTTLKPLYLLNTPRGRAAAEGLGARGVEAGGRDGPGRVDARSTQRVQPVRAEHRPVDADDRRALARGRVDLSGGVDRGSVRYRRREQRAKMELRPGDPGWLAATGKR